MWLQRGFLVSAGLLVACTHTQLDGGDPVALGSAFVDSRACRSCHGDKLDGASMPQSGTRAYPSNLTPDPKTGLGRWATIEIIRAMRFGIDEDGQPLCEAMPRFPAMTDLEANAIVAYLRSLPAITRVIAASECPSIDPVELPDLSAQTPLDLGGGGD